ncbi:Uncharacterized protein TPAR_06840 [Tolypocladium paradoxum]|uniref:Uncharacterized protein n=1 Tax=Tolypocladium paradoxum TaxID=94208 RepID=A0A2S4KRV7_9HYPO|nr:Uncharacterized protein TPAR_06840 [Tolypocladium paradoxum]
MLANSEIDNPSTLDTDVGYTIYERLPFIHQGSGTGTCVGVGPSLHATSRMFRRSVYSNPQRVCRMHFLHVHPIIPLLDEGDFWDAYLFAAGDEIPLLFIQAILFATSPFIPVVFAEAIGFDSPRSAATILYKRAKVLQPIIRCCASTQLLAENVSSRAYEVKYILVEFSHPNGETPICSAHIDCSLRKATV